MTVKHTPGPWRKSARPNDGCCHDAGIEDANGEHVADVADEQDVPLIAAAPALADGADIVARQDVTAAIAFLLMNGEKPPGCDSDEPERAYTLEHSYEDDARYTYPARSKLWSAVLSVGLRAAGRLP